MVGVPPKRITLPSKFIQTYDSIFKAVKASNPDKLGEIPENWSWAVCAAAIAEDRRVNAAPGRASPSQTSLSQMVSNYVNQYGRLLKLNSNTDWPDLKDVFHKLKIEIEENKRYKSIRAPFDEDITAELDKGKPVITSIGYREDNNDDTRHLYYTFMLITGYEPKGTMRTLFQIEDPVHPLATTWLESIDVLVRKDSRMRIATWHRTWRLK
jgi:hypothetical protein